MLTAVMLTQMSVGKSVKATIDYSLGTLGDAIYARLIASFVPCLNDAAPAADLAIAIAPVALLAAISPRFAAAPSSALLAVGYGHAANIRSCHTCCESLVHTQMGALKPTPQQPTVGLLDAARRTCALDAEAAGGESLKF
jgi:hypothetical protein